MSLGPWQIAIIALLIILLFGAPKLPQLAKSVGQSMRIFKSEVSTLKDDKDEGDAADSADSAQQKDRPAVEGRVVTAEDPTAQDPTAQDPAARQRRGEGAEQRRDRS